MKIVVFFNNKGGVGKTSLVYHLSWMYADPGYQVVAADLDPQANLTTMFLADNTLEDLWDDGDQATTVFRAVSPLLGVGDVVEPLPVRVHDRLDLIVGDIGLSAFEDPLSEQWTRCLAGDLRAFHVISAFYRVLRQAAESQEADVVLVDVGPNLGAINRAAVIAADFIVIPVTADLFALRGLINLGPSLRDWQRGWRKRLDEFHEKHQDVIPLPTGSMKPAGYIAMQHAIHSGRPVKAYMRWMERIPGVYREHVLADSTIAPTSVDHDEHCLASLKHYRSLMPMAQEARKPIFHLTSADGALGAHTYAVKDCRRDFASLARSLAKRCSLTSK